MKSSVVIINYLSSGGVINEDDLNEALKQRNDYMAPDLDVFEKEPPDKDNPLLKHNRVILSPHAATFTRRVRC